MKIIHLPAFAYPYHSGGKEVIVHKLSRALNGMGNDAEVCVNSTNIVDYPLDNRTVDGVIIRTLGELKGRFINRLEKGAELEFRKCLELLDPDIIHFHEHSKGASLAHLRIVKDLGIKVIYTYHTPGQSCPQGGLLKNNKIPCDGKVEINQCTTCRYYTSGVGYPFAELLSAVSPSTKGLLPRQFYYKAEVIEYKRYFDEFVSLVDAIHIYSPWVGEMLQSNGVPSHKIELVQLGNTYPNAFKSEVNNDKLKLAFLGRCEPVKGIEVIIDAAKNILAQDIEISFFSGSWLKNEYGKKMLSKIKNDSRFCPPTMLSQDELPERLSQFDAVIIPSLWKETGPLTVFDAFNAGVPVIASNLGGLADRVKPNVDGLLFETGSVNELVEIFNNCVKDRGVLKKLRNNVKPHNTMEQMAEGIHNLYNKVLKA